MRFLHFPRFSPLIALLTFTILAATIAVAQDTVDTGTPGACTSGGTATACVATYHNDSARDGVQSHESALNPLLFNSQNQSASNFGLLGTTPASGSSAVDGLLYAQPLYLSSVAMNTANCPSTGNPYNLIILATENNSVYAYTYTYTLTSTGHTFSLTQCWMKNLNNPNNAGETAIAFNQLPQDSSGIPCNNIVPQSGITSTPVIDTSVTPPTLFVVTAHQTPNGSGGYTYAYRIHAIQVKTGTEPSPYDLSANNVFPSGVTAATENQRPGLALFKAPSGDARIYVGFGSYCDLGNYSGYLAALDFAYHAQTFSKIGTGWVFDTEKGATNQHGGIWMGGAAPAVDSAGNVYLSVGNGNWNGTSSSGGPNYGESVLKIATNTTSGLSVADYYTPNDFSALDVGGATLCSTYGPNSCPSGNALTLPGGAGAGDIDLGSGGVTLISPVGVTNPCGSNQALVAGGKEGVIYGICYSTNASGTQHIMGGLDLCGYGCSPSSQTSNQTNTACSQSSTPGSGYIAQCFEGVNAGEPNNILASPGIHGTEAFWGGTGLNYVYVAGAGTSASPTPMVAYQMNSSGTFVTAGDPEQRPTTYPYPGTVPAVSWDGISSSNGLLWAINSGAYGQWVNVNGTSQSMPAGPAVLVVYQAVPQTIQGKTILNELWASSINQSNYGPGAVKFSVPSVANGLVLVPGGTSGYAPGLPGGTNVNCTAAALANTQTPTVCQGMLSIYGKVHQ